VNSHGLFAGTAPSYAEFRPPYPRDLLDLLVSAEPGHGRLVDLGCGTGELARPLARAFDEVIAVDVEPGMISAGIARAGQEGIGNITWLTGKAETAPLDPGSADLITIGAAFHWMDRQLILDRARAALVPGGALAVVGGNSPWTGKEPWQKLIVSVMEEVIGPRRRAGQGEFRRPAEPHEVVMARQGFSDVAQHDFLTPCTWTLGGILGYLRSTSFASRAVLGDKADQFDRILTDRLLALNSDGTYSEVLPFYALLGHPDRSQP
jgi:SAM-dependent methyltransferase